MVYVSYYFQREMLEREKNDLKKDIDKLNQQLYESTQRERKLSDELKLVRKELEVWKNKKRVK